MRLTRTLAFRLIALYVLLFAVSVAVLFGIVWLAAEQGIKAQIAENVQREAISLADEYSTTDAATAAVLVDRRLQRGRSSYYLLQDISGNLLAGNVAPVVPLLGAFESRVQLPAALGATRASPEIRNVIGFGVLLADGTFVMAADDSERVETTKSAILKAFGVAGALSTVLAIVGGLLLSRGFLRRIDAVNWTASEIMAGRLDARIPTRENGDEIDTLATNLNTMLDRLQSLMENLKQVLSDIAHDLRTPLSRLQQELDVARRESTSVAQFRDATDRAIRESEGLLQTFSALLRIAQIESKSRRGSFGAVDLSELLHFAVATFAPIAEDEGHTLREEIAPDVSILGDKELILQMATNLLENSIRHTPRGCSIRLALVRDETGIMVTIADNGPGIPVEERDKVLRRFYRLEASRSSPGSGLGLALVAAVVELHGGTISLGDNSPGLVVEIRLPDAGR